MNKLFLAIVTLLAATMLTAGHANACGFFDFSCNAAKQKAEKIQMVISIIDAGRKAGWKDVRREFTNREIAEMRKVGLDPTNGNLIGVLKDVNDEHFESLDQNSWEGVVEMIGKEDYVDKQIAKAKLGVDALDSLQKQYDKVTQNDSEFEAALTAEAQSTKQAELLEKIEVQRESLISRVDDLDSELELQVLSSAIGSAARTLDEAGVDIARSIMDGGNFDDMVSRAAAKVGMTQGAAREVLQDAVFFGVSEMAHESLTRTDGIAEAGHQAAATGDYAAAEKAAVEAHHAAVEATYAAERAAHKAEFIAQAMAEGASQAEAEQLASQAGH